MVISSWLAALSNALFGTRQPASRPRSKPAKLAPQTAHASEALEQRTLLTVNSVIDIYNTGIDEDHVFNVPAPGVLANDTGGVGTLVVIQVTNTAQGQAGITSSGEFSYDPRGSGTLQALNHGDLSVQEFTYKVADSFDGSVGNDAIVRLFVYGRNDQTTASGTTQSVNYAEDGGGQQVVAPIVVDDVDSGEVLTASLTLSDLAAGSLSAPGATFSAGVLSITGNKATVNAALAAVQFTPAADYDKTFTIGVDIRDGLEDGTAPVTGTITMTANPSNLDAPIASDSSFTINEDSVVYSGTLVGRDPDTIPPQTLHFELTGTAATKGTVVITNPATGAFTYTPHADAVGTDTFQFQIFDQDSLYSQVKTVTVQITPINDAPSFTKGANENVLEDSGLHTVNDWATSVNKGPLTAVDEITQTLSFEVTNDNPDLFDVAPAIDASGNLTYTLAPNAYGTATVSVVLKDNGGTANGGTDTSAPQTFDIVVTNVNDAPSFTKGADENVLEDSTPHSVANWATGISAGPFEASQTLTFNVTGNTNPDLFTSGPAIAADGTLTYTLAPNANGTATITITLSDNGGTANGGVDTSASQTFDITVTPVNDAPTFTKGADEAVLEDSGLHTVNGWATALAAGPLTATDETSQTLNFEVTNDNNALFSVQPAIDASGNLTYTLAPNAYGTATVSVVLKDNGGTANGGSDTSAPQTFDIVVTNVNDAPSFTKGADENVLEDSTPHSVANWATGISAGPFESDTLTFNVVGNTNPGLFTSGPAISANGTLTYTLAPDASGSATITISLSDNGGTANGGNDTSGTQVFTINVTPVNDAPSFTKGADEAVLEDSGLHTVNGWATGIAAGPITATDETSQTLNFEVTNDNPDLFDVAPAIDASGNLTYTLAPNAFGTATVSVVLKDNGGTANGGTDTSSPQTFDIVVTNVNDAPSFTKGADENVLEDSTPHSVANWATGISAGPFEASQTLTFNVTGNTNPDLFTSGPAIAADGTLTYTLAPNANGTATITISLSDNGGTANGGNDTSGTQVFTINVTPVNDAPSFTKGADEAVLEDSGLHTVNGWATALAAGPLTATDETSQTLNFEVTNDNPDLFDVAPAIDASGNLTYTLAPNAYGTATVTVVLKDNGGTANGGSDTSAPQTFDIVVTNVNDAPSFTKGADENVLEDSTPHSVANWATGISAGPFEASQTLTFNVTGNTNPDLFTSGPAIAADGTLSYTLAPNANGTATITITLSDNGGTANGGVDTSASQTFDITVTPVNDAPTFTKGADEAVLEDSGLHTVNGWATVLSQGPTSDETSQTLTFNVTNDNNALFSVQPAIDGSGNLTYTLAPNAFGTATVTVTLSDDGGTANGGTDTSAPQTFDIVVTNVNDAPSFTKGADENVLEDSTPHSVANWATGISAGPFEASQTLTFNVTDNTNPGLFTTGPAISANGTLTYTLAPDANGSATITISLSDNGGTANGGNDTSGTQVFTINVTPVNDAPSFTKGADEAVLEDSGLHTVNGWATGIAAGPITATDETSQTLNFEVTNDNPDLFDVAPAIDASGNLTYTLAPNAYGTATVTVVLKDNGGTANGGTDNSAPQTFDIVVTNVNDAPSFTKGADENVLEDSTPHSVANWATGISAGPFEASQTLTFNVTGNTNPDLFTSGPAIAADGTLTYTLAPNANGTATITITLSDNGGTANGGVDTSASQTFDITVTPVNDAPTFTKGADEAVLEDSGLHTVNGWATVLSQGPTSDETSQTLTFNVTNDNNALFSVQPAIDASGNLTYTLAPNAFGTATVTVTLSDNGGTANGGTDTSAPQTFDIVVASVNDAPTFNLPGLPDQSILEDAGLQSVAGFATAISTGAANESSQTLTFQISTNGNDAKFTTLPTIDSTTGTLTYQTAPNVNGDVLISVTLKDNGGTANGGVDTSTTHTFTIHIAPVNDIPVANDDTSVTTPEDTPVPIYVLTNDFDVDGDALEIFVNAPSHGVAAVNDNGTPGDYTDDFIEYTPAPDYFGADSFTYLVSDHHGGTDTATVNIMVTSRNDAPTFTVGSNQSSAEDAGAQTVTGFISVFSPGPANESGQLTDFIVDNNNPTLFSVQPAIDANGNLTYTAAPDQHGVATVSVRIHDNGGTSNGGSDTSAVQTFTITINSVNDTPSFSVGSNQSTAEDAGAQTVTGFISTFSPGPANESGQTIHFIVTNDNNALFSSQPAIDASGNLTYTAAPNANGSATVTVQIQDNGGGADTSATQTFTITITAVNDTPSFTVGSNQSTAEDAGAQTVTGFISTFSPGPANESGQTIHFIVTNDNDALFSSQPAIDASGNLTYTAAPNANGSATVTVQIQDNGGGADTSATQTFTITITAVNDTPSFTAGSNQSTAEDAGAQTVTGFISTFSPGPANESGQTIHFIVTNDNNPLFSSQPAIDASGNLTYTAAPNANGSATVTVQIQDNGGGADTSATQTFTITITAVNDTPSFTVGSNQSTAEDAGAQTVTGFISTFSPGPANESGQTIHFIVTNDNNPLFSSQPAIDASGNLTYTAAPNANGSATVTVQIQDNGGGADTSATQTFTITITAVNDTPSFTVGSNQSTAEDAGTQTVTGFISTFSPGPANESGQTIHFIVTNDNNPLFSSQPAIDASGNLTYTAAPNANGSATVTVQIQDNGGGADTSATQTFTITITAVNDTPSFTVGSNQSTAEDAGAQTVTGFISTFSPGPANESGQTIHFIVTNDNNPLFASQPAIDASGNLTYTAAPNANGSATVTVQIQDNGGGADTSATQTFTITITAVNDTPSFTVGSNQSTAEDAGTQTVTGFISTFSPGPANESGQTIHFIVTNDNNPLFSSQPAIDASGNLTYTAAPNANGSATVTVQIQDNGGGADTSATQTFTITITAVNDTPSFTVGSNQSTAEDAGAQTVTGFISTFSPGPANESGQTIHFIVTNDNNPLFSSQPAIDASGNLTYTAAPNANGSATVTVQIQDNGGGADTSATQTFTITITAVNDTPSFTVGSNQSTAEDAGAQTVTGFISTFSPGPANESGQTIHFIVTNDNNALFSSQPAIDASGNLTYTAAPNANGSATVTVQIQDNGGGADTSTTQTFTITITAQPDAPVIDDATFTVPENSSVNTVVGTIVSTDPDIGDTHTFSITGGNTGGTFAINPTTGVITVAASSLLDFETNPTFHLTVTVTDGNSLVDTCVVTVNLTNVIEPPVLSLPSNPNTFYIRHGRTIIDAAASAIAEEPLDFRGGKLTVQVTQNANSNDRLEIYSQATGPGKITVSNKNVSYGGTLIGKITQTGAGSTALVITFNQNVTAAAVDALLKVMSFKSTSTTPPTSQRTIRFRLENAANSASITNTQLMNVSTSPPSRGITISGNPTVYVNGTSPVVIAPTALVTGPATLDFDGARLSVQITTGSNKSNRLNISSIGGITLAGSDVLYNGNKIGRATLGNNSLSVNLESLNATPEAVQALTRAINFSTLNSNIVLLNRIATFKITDVTGTTSTGATQTITFGQV